MSTPDPRCSWCHERKSEHDVLGVGCEEFLPHDWRAVAHAIVDMLIDARPKIGVFASEDGAWLRSSLRLRAAIRNQIEGDRESA